MKQIHEYAEIFPLIEGEDFEAMKKDIKAHGLINPITLKDDKILDGRNRARACEAVGVRPKYEEFKNGNAFEFVISQNILRRHLTVSQRSVIALDLEAVFAKEAETKKGGRPVGSKTGVKNDAGFRDRSKSSAERAAKALHVSPTNVKSAKRLAKNAPEKVADVRAGKKTVKEALVESLSERAEAAVKKENALVLKKHLQEKSKQAAEFFAAMKSYAAALKTATLCVERFAPEAVGFVTKRTAEIQELQFELISAMKKHHGK